MATTAARQPRKWWHLTDNRRFDIDPTFKPGGWNSDFQERIPGAHLAGLWVTPNPGLWYWLWGGRPYAAEIKMPPDIAARAASRMMSGLGGESRPRDQYHLSAEELAQCAVGEVVDTQRAIREAEKDGYGFALVGTEPDTYKRHYVAEMEVFKIVSNRGWPEKAVCGTKLYQDEQAFEWTTFTGAEVWIGRDGGCQQCLTKLRARSR